MNPNIGPLDRLIRLILGIVLIGAALSGNTLFGGIAVQYVAFALGIIAILTSVIRFCPLYRILGIQTCDCEAS